MPVSRKKLGGSIGGADAVPVRKKLGGSIGGAGAAPVRKKLGGSIGGAGAAPVRKKLGQSVVATRAVPRLIRSGPRPEWRVGELTVVIGRSRAELRYAREAVAFCEPTAGAIVAAAQRARDRLAARSRGPDELLPALARAYAAVLGRRGARPGDRVPLVELRDQLVGYTRAQFSWDVARLRRERRLAIGGRRLDLGVATGHATARRSSVVWIENEGGGGSYFASFRLIAQEVST